MRDPMQWAVTVFRAAGVPVRVHVAFLVFAAGLSARQIQTPAGAERPVTVLLLTTVALFFVALVHELGRLVAARYAGADCRELVVWPLGGLQPATDAPDWKAHAVASLGGPAALGLVCLLGSAVLVACGYVPNVRPLSDPYASEVRHVRDGKVYTSKFALRLYERGTNTPRELTEEQKKLVNSDHLSDSSTMTQGTDRALLPEWLAWVNRVVWLSFVVLLLNLLPAPPLGIGGVLEALVWWRSDHAQGVGVAAYAGYVVAVGCAIVGYALNEVSVLSLALVIGAVCWARLRPADPEDAPFGDFAAGYPNFDADESPPAPRPRRQPFLKRWLTARATKRMHRENEARQRDEDRMDEVLDKIARTGKASLTDDERRLMERVSARYRNRQWE